MSDRLTREQKLARFSVLSAKTHDTHKFGVAVGDLAPAEHAEALRDMRAEGWIDWIDRCRLPHLNAERPGLGNVLCDIYIVTPRGLAWLAAQDASTK